MSAPPPTIPAAEIKATALALGVDLVGIADGGNFENHVPPGSPKKPSQMTERDGGRVIVLAKRYMSGTTRITRWDERHKHYNDELTIDLIEEAALRLVYWLEERGGAGMVIPPAVANPLSDRTDGSSPAHFSLEHAAVEAGLGTLGLNLQLLTPEYGPRVILSGVLCNVDCETDIPMTAALCHGPECGRCLSTCPGDVVGHWSRDWAGCDAYRSPHGFEKLTGQMVKILGEPEPDAKLGLIKSEESFHAWMSILRGAGVTTGCRRCQDVCPVGGDYEPMHKDALDVIPEDTPEKQARLAVMVDDEKNGTRPPAFDAQRRWIGDPGATKPEDATNAHTGGRGRAAGKGTA